MGANIGIYSIYAACVHKDIKIISFEPSTSNLRILSRNISINGLEKKITINQFPLSDLTNTYQTMNETEFKEGYSMSTFFYKTNFEGNKLKPKQRYKIFGTTIDYLIKNNILDVPDYIKIDVDGIEHKILSGASDLLKNLKLKSVLLEVNENYPEQFKKIVKLMRNNNFTNLSKNQLPDLEKSKFAKSYNYIYSRVKKISLN